MITRTKQQPGTDLLKDTKCKVGRGSIVHGDSDHAAVGASEESTHPGRGVGTPKYHPVAFADAAGGKFACKAVSSGSDIAVGGADDAVSVGRGESGFFAEAGEILQVIGDV